MSRSPKRYRPPTGAAVRYPHRLGEYLRDDPRMPRLSAFYGVVIYMYWRDHSPPHFHAEYGDQEAPS